VRTLEHWEQMKVFGAVMYALYYAGRWMRARARPTVERGTFTVAAISRTVLPRW
jgi:hypothetical protein